MLATQIGIVFERFGVFAQNRLQMGAMRAEIAEKFQDFNFAGLLLWDRSRQYSVVYAFSQWGWRYRSR